MRQRKAMKFKHDVQKFRPIYKDNRGEKNHLNKVSTKIFLKKVKRTRLLKNNSKSCQQCFEMGKSKSRKENNSKSIVC